MQEEINYSAFEHKVRILKCFSYSGIFDYESLV